MLTNRKRWELWIQEEKNKRRKSLGHFKTIWLLLSIAVLFWRVPLLSVPVYVYDVFSRLHAVIWRWGWYTAKARSKGCVYNVTYIHTYIHTYICTYIQTCIPPCCTQQLAIVMYHVTVHACDTWWCSGVRILHVKLPPLLTYFPTATASPQWTAMWRWSDRLWWLLQWWYHLSFSSSTYPPCEPLPQTHPHYTHTCTTCACYCVCACSVWSLLSPQRGRSCVWHCLCDEQCHHSMLWLFLRYCCVIFRLDFWLWITL